jgi:anti-sigma B factor antagonist
MAPLRNQSERTMARPGLAVLQALGDTMKVSARAGLHNGIPVLHLSGELDMANLADLRAVVAKVAGAGACLILDLRHVSYMDSSPLGFMIDLHRRLSERGGALAITACPPGVDRVFQMAGLAAAMNLFDGLDEAEEYLSSVRRREVSHGPEEG